MKHPVAFPSVHENSEAKRNKFRAGVRAYALDYYVPEYVPSDTDLLCAFRIEPLQGVDMIEASAAVAAESSTATWTEVWSNQLTDIDYFAAAREHAPTGSPPKRSPPAKHSMMQPRPAQNCVRRWNCGARSSSESRIEKWCAHACADRSNKCQTVQRCSRDQTTPDHSRYRRRQCSR